MPIPARNVSALSLSLTAWRSVSVLGIGEKPRAGMPAARTKRASVAPGGMTGSRVTFLDKKSSKFLKNTIQSLFTPMLYNYYGDVM